jgi:hypothetical protein
MQLLCNRLQLFKFQFGLFLIMQVTPSFVMQLGNQILTPSRLPQASASSSRWRAIYTADISLSLLYPLLHPLLYRLRPSVFFSPPS